VNSARTIAKPKPAGLRVRLAEAEETLRAIRNGEVDAVLVAGRGGDQVFTLEGAGHAYRVLIESMNEGALTLTAELVILYANQCFATMVGQPLEQLMGGSLERYLSAADWAILRPLLQSSGEAGTKLQLQLHLGDGRLVPVQISIRLFKSNGSNATIGVVVTDMTEAQRVAQQQETERLYAQVLEQAAELERRVEERTRQLSLANLELEAFESSVSHDLRGPLRHVTGFAHILIEEHGPQLPPPARAYLDRIIASTEKMDRLISALLEFSSMSKRQLALQSVDVAAMWREVLEEMTPDFGTRLIEVAIGPLAPCRADPILLRQVLVNLLGNALKYSRTRERSVITIAGAPQPDGFDWGYSIKDNGIGFDMKDAGKLFTAFERMPSSRAFEGSGVGLTTASRIVRRHGGRIWAESAPDAGATFFFTLGPSPAP
jgi:PAS domain S-box-containing protein